MSASSSTFTIPDALHRARTSVKQASRFPPTCVFARAKCKRRPCFREPELPFLLAPRDLSSSRSSRGAHHAPDLRPQRGLYSSTSSEISCLLAPGRVPGACCSQPITTAINGAIFLVLPRVLLVLRSSKSFHAWETFFETPIPPPRIPHAGFHNLSHSARCTTSLYPTSLARPSTCLILRVHSEKRTPAHDIVLSDTRSCSRCIPRVVYVVHDLRHRCDRCRTPKIQSAASTVKRPPPIYQNSVSRGTARICSGCMMEKLETPLEQHESETASLPSPAGHREVQDISRKGVVSYFCPSPCPQPSPETRGDPCCSVFRIEGIPDRSTATDRPNEPRPW